jgi:ribosomal protein L14
MIQMKSVMKVIDNSGAQLAECIKVLRNGKYASLGDEVVVVVKRARPISTAGSNGNGRGPTTSTTEGGALRKGDVRRAVIVRTKKETSRLDGRYIKFDDNACVLLNNQGQPLGTRILGVVANELRLKKWTKIISLAPRTV